MLLRPLCLAIAATLTLGLGACKQNQDTAPASTVSPSEPASDIAAKVASYAEVPLTADLSHLGEGDRKAIDLLLQAGVPEQRIY